VVADDGTNDEAEVFFSSSFQGCNPVVRSLTGNAADEAELLLLEAAGAST